VVDILLILEGAAYVGFIAGAIFAVLELRGISRERRANTIVDMYQTFIGPDMTDAWAKVFANSSQSGADMEKDCSLSVLVRVAGFYEAVGYLTRKRLIDPKIAVELLPIETAWNKMQPWLLFDRARSSPGAWMEFEFITRASEVLSKDVEYVAKVTADIDALEKRKKM
jgi:hypothetical protein